MCPPPINFADVYARYAREGARDNGRRAENDNRPAEQQPGEATDTADEADSERDGEAESA